MDDFKIIYHENNFLSKYMYIINTIYEKDKKANNSYN